MSRGRPRHHSSRRRMYSSRQRDVRERRSREHVDSYAADERSAWIEADEAVELDVAPSWSVRLGARASAA